jgi:hypothetical protein
MIVTPVRAGAAKKLLTDKMTATVETDEFNEWAAAVIERIGPYPAGAMSAMSRKKQTTRLLKCECESCGYTVRIARKWVDEAGTPICPSDMVSMICEAINDGDFE